MIKERLNLLRSAAWPRRRRPPPPRPRIVALLTVRNEMRYLTGYFENVATQVDGVVALDDGSTDGSTELLAGQPAVIELIRLPPREPHVWDDGANHRRLIEAARAHRPDWMIGLDADERLERQFRLRVEAAIEQARWRGIRAYAVTLRELWNRPDTYRVDGIWGTKRRARLFRMPAHPRFDERRHHGQWAPINTRRLGRFPEADLIVYHLRMIDARDREARRDRYRQLDPDRRYQPIGYDYLTDETGLVLEHLPPGREYEPLGR